jgi:hypothetical protein
MNAPAPSPPPSPIRCPVIELRQYTLLPDRRDVLIELFDREFVETQEVVGIHVLGQFRDLADPDRFVWLRGFPDMAARAAALTAFYLEGAAWRTHGAAAAATMLDSDDVLLLRPVDARSGFPPPETARPAPGAETRPASRVMVTIYHRDAPVDEGFTRFFRDHVAPLMAETGARPMACFQTEPAENTFPRLPVRTGENVFVWFASFASRDDHVEHAGRLARSRAWNERVLPELSARLNRPPRRLALEPTSRSQLR